MRLSRPQREMLNHLMTHGPIRDSDLRWVEHRRPMQDLEQHGLIEVEALWADARQIQITPAGMRAVRQEQDKAPPRGWRLLRWLFGSAA